MSGIPPLMRHDGGIFSQISAWLLAVSPVSLKLWFMLRLRLLSGLLLSLLLHTAALWLLLWRAAPELPPMPVAALMLEYAADFQVALLTETAPPGINQLRNVEARLEQPAEQELQQKQPVPVETEQGELEKRQQKKIKPEKKPQPKKIVSKPQAAVAGNATVTNRAAPPVQQRVTSRTAAPLESNNSQGENPLFSWEARVKAKIDRVKMYPPEAERRGRSGTVQVSFTVDGQGKVLVSAVRKSSGTIALDRAALAALANAQPLPAPPADLLNGGVHKVLMPVNFSLQK